LDPESVDPVEAGLGGIEGLPIPTVCEIVFSCEDAGVLSTSFVFLFLDNFENSHLSQTLGFFGHLKAITPNNATRKLGTPIAIPIMLSLLRPLLLVGVNVSLEVGTGATATGVGLTRTIIRLAEKVTNY